jgi:lipopolysaccharide transport system ATP-binding protein
VFDNVWKKFRRGERHDSLRDLIPSFTKKMFGRARSSDLESTDEFWAVKGLSFEMERGEALGIIGPNGAGKSTTLKLLTRILRPTRGSCRLNGRVGALIEVAAGFHPDLTGRENIYLQGAVMGMKRAEIATKLDEIIEFAGVADFIDTQVKRYSSGMNARLGFAIAAHLDPDVLVIDEVLSVGDIAFQQRCVERMERFKKDGVTIIFVSHNLQAVATLCNRALYLKREVRSLGPVSQALVAYLADVSAIEQPAAGAVEITSAALTGFDPRDATTVAAGASLNLRVNYAVRKDASDVTLGFILYRSADQLIVYEGNYLVGDVLGSSDLRAGTEFGVDFGFVANVTRGQYHIECYALHNPTHEYISRLSPAAMVTVMEQRTCRGVADVNLRAMAIRPTNALVETAPSPSVIGAPAVFERAKAV